MVLSGGNIDPLLLASIIERGMVRAGRLARICIGSRGAPGTLSRITALLAEEGGNVRKYFISVHSPTWLHRMSRSSWSFRLGAIVTSTKSFRA